MDKINILLVIIVYLLIIYFLNYFKLCFKYIQYFEELSYDLNILKYDYTIIFFIGI